MIRYVICALTLFAASTSLLAQGPALLTASEVADWREDVRTLGVELPRRHKNAFARMTRAQWDSAVQRLDSRLPQLRRHQVIGEIMRLVAMVRDGHTALNPDFEERTGFHRLPIRLYDFADGLFVVAADSAHRDVAGARVVRIGRANAAAALDSAARVVSHEGANWARFRAASLLTIPEVLAALGLSDHPLKASFTLEQSGRERTVVLEAKGGAAGGGHGPIVPNGMVDMRAPAPGDDPLWLQQPSRAYWFTILPDRTLYINHRAVQFIDAGVTNETFFRRAFAAADSAAVERVVLDMRVNGGGNNFLNRFLVKEIIRRPNLDRPDRFFVLIGRGVFSAAQNLVNELDFYTSATFVGEPTGNAPNQYGDARPLELPRSKLRIFVSSLYWQGHSAMDERTWFTPDVFVEVTSADYRAKRDPVLETALRHAAAPSLAQRLTADAERGDTASVRRAVEDYRANPENRFRSVESEVNSAGYELLNSRRANAAIAVFQVNSVLFPHSANVFDSLAEAYERAGQREAAIAAYRKALGLNPGMGSAREGLRRLGVAVGP
jgi:hypothetical protein